MCQCCGKHVPKPMVLLDLYYLDVINDVENEVGPSINLCPTTFANVEHLWSIYQQHEGRPPWHVLQNYSQFVQEIVEHMRELQRRSSSAQAHGSVGATSSPGLGRDIISEALRPNVVASEATRNSMVD